MEIVMLCVKVWSKASYPIRFYNGLRIMFQWHSTSVLTKSVQINLIRARLNPSVDPIRDRPYLY
jgi:hypothetical protein